MVNTHHLMNPDAVGGLNDQTPAMAGVEANLDVQFAYGLSFPTPGTFWSTAGRPPFSPDVGTPTNTNGHNSHFLILHTGLTILLNRTIFRRKSATEDLKVC